MRLVSVCVRAYASATRACVVFIHNDFRRFYIILCVCLDGLTLCAACTLLMSYTRHINIHCTAHKIYVSLAMKYIHSYVCARCELAMHTDGERGSDKEATEQWQRWDEGDGRGRRDTGRTRRIISFGTLKLADLCVIHEMNAADNWALISFNLIFAVQYFYLFFSFTRFGFLLHFVASFS